MTVISTFLASWVTAHAALVSVLVLVLACLVIVDHYLAASSQFASNSSAQVFFKWLGIIADGALKILSPATEASLPVIPPQPAAPAAPAPAASASAPASPSQPAGGSSS